MNILTTVEKFSKRESRNNYLNACGPTESKKHNSVEREVKCPTTRKKKNHIEGETETHLITFPYVFKEIIIGLEIIFF